MPASDFIMFPIRFSRGAGSMMAEEVEKEGGYVNRQRQKRWMVMALLFAVCMGIGGCGGSTATRGRKGTHERGASGSAVSGDAVSGAAIREKKEDKKNVKYRYATDTDYYYSDYDDDARYYVIQERRDGTQTREIIKTKKNRGCEVHYVDADWLYYVEECKENVCVLYRVPIEKDAEGFDVVNLSLREELVRESGIYTSYWDDRYVVYDTDSEFVRYDRKNKKTVSRQKFEKLVMDIDDDIDFFGIPGGYVVLIEGKSPYVQYDGETDWHPCGTETNICYSGLGSVQTENAVYYLAEEKEAWERELFGELPFEQLPLWKCDGKTTERVLTLPQMKAAMKEAKGMGAADELDDFGVTDMYASGGRLYVQFGLNWREDTVYRMEYVLFSIAEEGGELRYEKELTECMQSRVKTRLGEWRREKKVYEDNVAVNDACCVHIMNGMAYLSLYDYEKDRGRMGCYELQSGQFRWLSKEEELCRELQYEGNDWGTDVFDEAECNTFLGVWSAPSSVSAEKEERGIGDFYETEQ